MTETELLHLALAHADRLARFARQLAGDTIRADDLVQETLVRALECRGQLEDPARVLPWMMKILRQRFLAERRTASRRLRLVEAEQPLDPPVGNLEEELCRGALSEDVRRALDALPEEWKSAILLCEVEGFSYHEIAAAMECPVGTVRSRIARARARLVEELASVAAARGLGKGGRP